ncbi:hypothetical protein ABPG74_006552 [Tetrahymena malaccensis]
MFGRLFTHQSKLIGAAQKYQHSNIQFANKFNSLSFNPYYNFCLRNIGISAHIDSGKTTFTERVLFYAGKINAIHDVKGTDGVGATMDFMDLEREKGITIQSAATHLKWNGTSINVIDTPGHVDFTIEVERALRVLDGGVLLLCGVAGVQPQTLTVFKQMVRYSVPRIIFINKLDRMGANPWAAIDSVRKRLNIHAAAVQIPIGIDSSLKGLVDIIKMKAIIFEGESGEILNVQDIPANLMELAKEKRHELIEVLAEIDPQIEEKYLAEEELTAEEIKAAIRRQTIALKFSPVFMGSAFKNKGVQLALDGVQDYLPKPEERKNVGFLQKDETQAEEKIDFIPDPKLPFVGYAFKLEESKFGQLTYVRVYQGKLKRGDNVYNTTVKKRMKISRMIKMHANQMEEINEAGPGEIFAIFGVECATGDTLCEGDMSYTARCSSMHVPPPVVNLSIKPKDNKSSAKFNKALKKFSREDPTFRVSIDKESEEIVISGMGELHLQIYAERMKREFDVEVVLGNPTVNYRETITQKAHFDYLHKKQSGGAGQFARVIGYVEPMINPEDPQDFSCQFVNKVIGTNVPNEYVTACEKSFYDVIDKGPQTGYPVVNLKFVLEDGQTHVVDSSSNAFMIATKYAFNKAFNDAGPVILEPFMNVEVTCAAAEYQSVMAAISKRRGLITNTESRGDIFILNADCPLSQMFGFATELRGLTSGQGEFSMEYKSHEPIDPSQAEEVKKQYQIRRKDKGQD